MRKVKQFMLCGLLVLSAQVSASTLCESMAQNTDQITKLKPVNYLNHANWKNFDVVTDYNVNRCLSSVRQDIISYEGKEFFRYRTMEDGCDGGNTYGAIYTRDLSKAVAHIYDGDLYCESSWHDEFLAKNHKCNPQAKTLAKQKMRELGLNFEPTFSRVKIRDPYTYDFIYVQGQLKDSKKEVRVKALSITETCQLGSMSIDYLEL